MLAHGINAFEERCIGRSLPLHLDILAITQQDPLQLLVDADMKMYAPWFILTETGRHLFLRRMNRIGHQEIVNVSAICRNGDVNGFHRTVLEVGDTHDVVEISGIVNALWLMIHQICAQDKVVINTVDSKSIITLPWVTISIERFVCIVCHLLYISKEEPSLVVLLQIVRRKHKMLGVIAVDGMIGECHHFAVADGKENLLHPVDVVEHTYGRNANDVSFHFFVAKGRARIADNFFQ